MPSTATDPTPWKPGDPCHYTIRDPVYNYDVGERRAVVAVVVESEGWADVLEDGDGTKRRLLLSDLRRPLKVS